MNDASPDLAPQAPDTRRDGLVKVAIMAVGGQGGGVLTNWIEDLARAQGYACQATSVAGVAQRTGATIYYVEMVPDTGRAPIFSLAPAAGDVDILIAAEMMEAGRAIMRGFVTPDRTVLIASTHRALAVSEKTVPGDGIATSAEVRAAAETASARVVMADMERLAADAGSVISASLFGALAGSGALPFGRAAFEDAIRRGGRGVEPSLRAFAAGFDAARGQTQDTPDRPVQAGPHAPTGPDDVLSEWQELETRAAALPAAVAEMAIPGLRKVVGFQDVDYGREYLEKIENLLARDSAARVFTFTREAAKYIANAMAYDDVIRVADLKTRRARLDRIRAEMKAEAGHGLHLTEFMHPRAEEIVGLFPARLGRWIERHPRILSVIDWLVNRGRRVRTDRLTGFTTLYLIAGLRRWRRGTLRHAAEQAHMQPWLDTALGHIDHDYALAVEILRCRRLIKGYSDTHARGQSKFDRVLAGAALVAGREDAADWVARLREAALKDEEGKTLDGALRTIQSFTNKKREEQP